MANFPSTDPPAGHDSDRRARHLETLERLQRGLAHDAKGPLNAAGLHLELLRSTLRGDDELAAKQSRWLQAMGEELRRLGATIHQLTDLVREPAAERGTVDLSELLREIETLVDAEARQARVPLRFEHPDAPLPTVMSRRDHLLQALLALVTDWVHSAPVAAERSADETPDLVLSLEDDPAANVQRLTLRATGVTARIDPRIERMLADEGVEISLIESGHPASTAILDIRSS